MGHGSQESATGEVRLAGKEEEEGEGEEEPEPT